jgi:Nitrile hydratase, alpha chain
MFPSYWRKFNSATGHLALPTDDKQSETIHLSMNLMIWNNLRNLVRSVPSLLTPQPVHVEFSLEQRLSDAIAEAVKNPKFKAGLMANPLQALADFGIRLPPQQSVQVLESTAHMTYLVLPVMTDQEVEALQKGMMGGRALRAIRSRVLLQAGRDPEYRSRLLADPKEVLQEAGLQIPDNTSVRVLENRFDRLHLVIPCLH